MAQKYLIWSFEHDAWWRFDSQGYTKKISDAGVYTENEALEICKDANIAFNERSEFPNEAIIPVFREKIVNK